MASPTSPPASAFLGAFGELLAQHKEWSGAFSLRSDRASNLSIVQNTNGALTTQPDRTEVLLSPRAGLDRTFGTHVSLHASGFRAFRAPTMNELYRTGQVGSEITLANPSLLSERATGFELGTQLNSTGRIPGQYQATYFWTEINRPVSAVLVSQTATTITNMRENLGQIRSRGVELSATFHPARTLTASVGYQYAPRHRHRILRATVTGRELDPRGSAPILHRAASRHSRALG